MNRFFGLALLSLMLVPSVASAATVGGKVDVRQGTEFGVIKFKAAKGEANRLTITNDRGQLRFHDQANRVKAKGDCTQVNARTARCPSTEQFAKVKLGNRADHAQVEVELVRLFGGAGDDVLHGFRGGDSLAGGKGNDELHGGPGRDRLVGGPGRDQLLGAGGDDELVDGETDGRSAPDLFRGGGSRDTKFAADRGDVVDYGRRKGSVEVDLGTGGNNTGDRIRGIESVVGGSGDDRLTGDGDDNWLEGKAGSDRLSGGAGDDIPQGGAGNDVVHGDDGKDTVWGDGGTDEMDGGAGDDQLISRGADSETLACGDGNDTADNTRTDTVVDCELSITSNLRAQVQPDISGRTATFRLACQNLGGCSGTIAITSLEGEDYGSAEFSDLPDDPQTFTDVQVELTQAGSSALGKGEIVQVAYGESGGYRAFIKRGG